MKISIITPTHDPKWMGELWPHLMPQAFDEWIVLLNGDTRQAQARFIDNTTIRFLPIIVKNYYPSQWHADNMIPYVRADLVAVKDGSRPHGPFWTAKG
jgi:hypothetical protein